MSLESRMGDSDEFEDSPRKKKRLLTILIVALFSISTTVAANVTLNKGKFLEFGQGIYKITACDQFVSVYLTPTAAVYASDGSYTGSGYSNVGNIRISGLDPVACAGTTIRVKLYTTGNATPLQIYTDTSTVANQSTGTGFSQMVWVINKTPQANPANDITLLDQNGANIGRSDANQYLKYTSATGDWTDIFSYPRAAVLQVNSLTIESASSP
jgi:hypothetical protein